MFVGKCLFKFGRHIIFNISLHLNLKYLIFKRRVFRKLDIKISSRLFYLFQDITIQSKFNLKYPMNLKKQRAKQNLSSLLLLFLEKIIQGLRSSRYLMCTYGLRNNQVQNTQVPNRTGTQNLVSLDWNKNKKKCSQICFSVIEKKKMPCEWFYIKSQLSRTHFALY